MAISKPWTTPNCATASQHDSNPSALNLFWMNLKALLMLPLLGLVVMGVVPLPLDAATQTCVPLWSQCGGIGWAGSTTCCPGSSCKYNSPYYSQCLAGSTGVASPSPSPSASSPSSGGASCSVLYAQCGGIGWTGPSSCCSGTCTFSNPYYSQCITAGGASSPLPSPTASPAATSPSPSSRSSPTAPSPSPLGSTSNFPLVSGVRGTYWGPSTDTGGCSLPETTYLIMDAIALGDMANVQAAYDISSHKMCGQASVILP